MNRNEIISKIRDTNNSIMEIVEAVVKDGTLLESLSEDDLLRIGNMARTISGNAQTITDVAYKKADEIAGI